MLDVNLRWRGVRILEVAEDPAVTLMSRVAADGGGSLRPGVRGYRTQRGAGDRADMGATAV